MIPDSDELETILHKPLSSGFGIYVNLPLYDGQFYNTYGTSVSTEKYQPDEQKQQAIITKAINEANTLINLGKLTPVKAVSYCARRCHKLMLMHMGEAESPTNKNGVGK
ncbi:hypothetical protein P7F88_25185 [Vibrio hannami]|uniref:hypothetical protein n=1 Tax=Vibrio hannami TaxID=2717094 RepID=UPI00240F44F2|nr:hypothetical protein [Vibrio hannami]MDG3089159.1 hypothetical protein [Vibrio hannami]